MKADFRWKVYIHIVPNGKYYVGITSKSVKRRWGVNGANYKSQLFYKAIEKYGWNNIEHQIIASNLTETEAKKFEELLIYKLKSNDVLYGYNLTIGGDGVSGFKRSKEFKDNCRKRMLGTKRPHKEETKLKIGIANKGKYGKEVIQIDKNNNVIRVFESIREAERITGINNTNISLVARGLRKTAGGYTWKFKENEVLV